jgi:hypothetical protein
MLFMVLIYLRCKRRCRLASVDGEAIRWAVVV